MSLTQDHKSGWMDILPTNLQEEKGGLSEVSAGAGSWSCVCEGGNDGGGRVGSLFQPLSARRSWCSAVAT